MDNKEFIIYSPDGAPEVTVAFILCNGDKATVKFEGPTTQVIGGCASLVHALVKKIPEAKDLLKLAIDLAMMGEGDEDNEIQ